MNKDDPWAGSYVYGRVEGVGKRVAHIVKGSLDRVYSRVDLIGLCLMKVDHLSPTTVPYPVCKDCRRIFLGT